jgi:hypothetical protein
VSDQVDPDEALIAELGSVLEAVDPVPPEVAAAAKAILGWRRLDADLAELLADSAVDTDRLAGVRGEGDPSLRRLSFGGAPLELDLEVHRAKAGDGRGRRARPVPARASCRHDVPPRRDRAPRLGHPADRDRLGSGLALSRQVGHDRADPAVVIPAAR